MKIIDTLHTIKMLWKSRGMYVIMDSKDNSITLSKRLFKHIKSHEDNTKVFVFRLRNTDEGGLYAFILNPGIGDTHYADLQYNEKYKCIGFESLVPTVNRMFYDYGIPFGIKAKLSVYPAYHEDMQKHYYIINRPKQ